MRTIGVGGSTAEKELEKIADRTANAVPISRNEYLSRIDKAVSIMITRKMDALYINAGSNLLYFTGIPWNASERMVGAILLQDGSLHYIVPKFEEGTFLKYCKVQAPIHCWEEHESPYQLVHHLLDYNGAKYLAVDEMAPWFLVDNLRRVVGSIQISVASKITTVCRMQKSESEIALLQKAKDITIEVQQAAAAILRVGISAQEVIDFIDNAHVKAGIPSGSYFCIVLFGADTQYPHGVAQPKTLQENEMVIIDTGCQLHGYISDITRSYVFGVPNKKQTEIWNLEKAAQEAAFHAAQLGATCGAVDAAARRVIANGGLSPNYDLPGLPHRVGHGTGLDIHEPPYLVRQNPQELKVGMVCSNEPMLCIPGAFGIRHEDHFYMTEAGPKWFTQPMPSIENPFGL
ncbi:MAG: Xaa-Pro peptidase family protein [Flavobacteriaceae bacterium]|nr:Xaa-Pro peptidase family protein [Flavobacteriaceae bacterium]